MPLPLTVIGGYLGAGKTTLVNRLLANADGRRIVVLVNDFGDIAVDTALIEADDGDTISFANGCVCCSLADGFVSALGRLREQSDRFDHVVVEVSGVGNPRSVAQWGHTPGFVLDGVVVLADTATIRNQVVDPYVGETVVAQLEAADLIVLTKRDLVGDRGDAARRAIVTYTGAPVVTDAVAFASLMVSPVRPVGTSSPPKGHVAHLSRTATGVRPISREELHQFLRDRPDGVVRVKGVVRLTDEDDPVVVQVVGRRVEFGPAPPRTAGTEPAVVAVAVPGTPVGQLDAWIAELDPDAEPVS